MAENTGRPSRDEDFRHDVTREADRKRHARARDHSPWFGLGMFGMVGWSVALPTVLGIALGLWLDGRYPDAGISFTLTFLGLGVAAGCLIAWQWIRREGHDA